MPMVSVRAVYDKGEVTLLEKAPVKDRYEVLVTFLAPEPSSHLTSERKRTLKDLQGIWRGVDLDLTDIQGHEYKMSEDLL